MAKSKSLFESTGWKVGMKYLYGWGAAIVIMGALFKILHWKFASEMLIVGLSTEAVIFFFSAFEPLPHEETHWSWDKVFPQLKEDNDDGSEESAVSGLDMLGGGGMPQFDPRAMAKAKEAFTPELFENLSTSIAGLKKGVDGLSDISSATVATNEFNTKIRTAAGNVEQLSASYSGSVEAMKKFTASMTQVSTYQEQINNDVKGYQTELKNVTKNLSSLSAVYEVELQDAKKHLESINKFYGSISGVVKNLLDTSKDTEALRTEVGHLSKNMHTLNAIYGGMLSAMASAKG